VVWAMPCACQRSYRTLCLPPVLRPVTQTLKYNTSFLRKMLFSLYIMWTC
jgi:hypothetical protein